jgi:hypothetical protein
VLHAAQLRAARLVVTAETPRRYLEGVQRDPRERWRGKYPAVNLNLPATLRPMYECFTPAAELRLDRLFAAGLISPDQMNSECWEAMLLMFENNFLCALDEFQSKLTEPASHWGERELVRNPCSFLTMLLGNYREKWQKRAAFLDPLTGEWNEQMRVKWLCYYCWHGFFDEAFENLNSLDDVTAGQALGYKQVRAGGRERSEASASASASEARQARVKRATGAGLASASASEAGNKNRAALVCGSAGWWSSKRE